MKCFAKLILIVCVFLIIFALPCKVSAEQPSLSFSEILNKGNDFIDKGSDSDKELNAAGLVKGMANILTTIGVVVVLAGLLIIGIKYMTATPEEAAKLKSKLVGLVISGVVIIGAYGIWYLVGFFLEGITTGHG